MSNEDLKKAIKTESRETYRAWLTELLERRQADERLLIVPSKKEGKSLTKGPLG